MLRLFGEIDGRRQQTHTPWISRGQNIERCHSSFFPHGKRPKVQVKYRIVELLNELIIPDVKLSEDVFGRSELKWKK